MKKKEKEIIAERRKKWKKGKQVHRDLFFRYKNERRYKKKRIYDTRSICLLWTGVNTNLLNRINFSWKLSADDFVAYAVCIFYVLTNREKNITDEKILKEFLSELHTHHPRKILKEAEFILTNFFPDLNN